MPLRYSDMIIMDLYLRQRKKISDPNDTYQACIQFLKDYLEIGYIEEIGQILSDMETNK